MKFKEAPKNVKIEVTENDIKRGKQGDGKSCAIALATKRVLGDHPDVDDGGISVHVAGYDHLYNIPDKATKFINKFDDDKKRVKPFSFVARLDQTEIDTPNFYED